jgi:hypothetical protein
MYVHINTHIQCFYQAVHDGTHADRKRICINKCVKSQKLHVYWCAVCFNLVAKIQHEITSQHVLEEKCVIYICVCVCVCVCACVRARTCARACVYAHIYRKRDGPKRWNFCHKNPNKLRVN